MPRLANRSKAHCIEVALTGMETHLALFALPGIESRIGTFANVVFECDDLGVTCEELCGAGSSSARNPTSDRGECGRSSKT